MRLHVFAMLAGALTCACDGNPLPIAPPQRDLAGSIADLSSPGPADLGSPRPADLGSPRLQDLALVACRSEWDCPRGTACDLVNHVCSIYCDSLGGGGRTQCNGTCCIERPLGVCARADGQQGNWACGNFGRCVNCSNLGLNCWMGMCR